ncbi:MAG: TonB-dependent receptor [Hyphomicrobiaceae bacterium]|nr:TonB-dependent receptor [Hyphomicrobiaceae bacterium]
MNTKRLRLSAAVIVAAGGFALPVGAQQPAAPPAPAAPAPSSGAAATPSGGSQLPPVDVIQQAPKPQQQQQAAPKPKPKPAPVAESPEPAPAPVAAVPAAPSTAEARAAGDIVPVSPLGGEIRVETYAGGVATVGGDAITGNGRSDPQDALAKSVPGVTLIDAGGSNFRSQLDYRGFGAGSINGFPQGIAAYQNGVRINEVFGDVVNWDLIPSNAIGDITIVSGNPVFGLNAIGGGAVISLKDGFSFQGVEIDSKFGSYGYKEIGTQIGVQSGPFALYFAGEHIDEDGWRDFSPAEVDRMYVDLGAKGSLVEVHANLTWAKSSVGVVAATPEELLNVGWERTFTSPQTTDLEVLMPSLNAKVKATETLTFSGLAYYRRYKSAVVDGNVLEAEECGEVQAENPGVGVEADFNADNICSEEIEDNTIAQLRDARGNPIAGDDIGEEPFGVIDRINQQAESFGGSLQATEKMQVFGRPNQFIAGVSYDRGNVRYSTASEIGELTSRYVVDGSGVIIAEPDDFAGRNVDVDTEYVGLYITNTFEVTDALAITVGGRYNHASVDLVDLTGEFDGITSSHTFERFNPSAGATYQIMQGLTVYAGYSEANRAPTPAELACANPDNPCPIESFLTDDPPLEQVVSRTYEAGLRGKLGSLGRDQVLGWGVGYFRTLNEDDILFVSSGTTGRGFFFNAGDTLRQGIEAKLTYDNQWLSLYAGYSYVHATYETALEYQSPAHPLGRPCSGDPEVTCIDVAPGDRLPNVPDHRFKAGVEYRVLPQWMIGADVIANSGVYHLGDDANLLPKVGGYARVDLKTTYDVTENVQIYGLLNNVFDSRYGVFGTLFENEEAPTDPVGIPGFTYDNPRSIVPGQPISAYGGVKVRF